MVDRLTPEELRDVVRRCSGDFDIMPDVGSRLVAAVVQLARTVVDANCACGTRRSDEGASLIEDLVHYDDCPVPYAKSLLEVADD